MQDLEKKIVNFNSNYILVLPSWYPSKLDEFNGDFNERLVYAVSNYRKQIVVYVTTKRTYQDKYKHYEYYEEGNILTYKAYYPFSKWFFINVIFMVRLYLKILKEIFKRHGLPKIVHTYVFLPAGIISYYLKYRYGVKTILTEHWSLFNKDRSDYINTHPFYKKVIYRQILNSFNAIILVAKRLESLLSEWTPTVKKYVFSNVVDVDFFNMLNDFQKPESDFTFIHVSNMGIHKNVIGILNAFKNVLEMGYKAKLILVGEENKNISDYIKKIDVLSENINYLGEVPYNQVAEALKMADVFLLFSRYENMPCVILESLCCGLPVISSNVGGISEVINEENGLLVANQEELEEAMIYTLNNYHIFDKKLISSKAISNFSYKEIGAKINKLYTDIENGVN